MAFLASRLFCKSSKCCLLLASNADVLLLRFAELDPPVRSVLTPPPAWRDPPSPSSDPPPAGGNPPSADADPPPTGGDPPSPDGDPPPTGGEPPPTGDDFPPTGDDSPYSGRKLPVPVAHPPPPDEDPLPPDDDAASPDDDALPPDDDAPPPGGGPPPWGVDGMLVLRGCIVDRVPVFPGTLLMAPGWPSGKTAWATPLPVPLKDMISL